MKKKLLLLPVMALLLMFGAGSWSCSDGDTEEEPTVVTSLPQPAQDFLKTYFTDYEIVRVTRNNDTPLWYEVQFRGGGEVKFDASGLWYEVEGDRGQAVPQGFYPAAIDTYVAANYPGRYIAEIQRDARGYEVDLDNDVDLLFNPEGAFLQVKH